MEGSAKSERRFEEIRSADTPVGRRLRGRLKSSISLQRDGRYAYAGNDPVNSLDFWGLKGCSTDNSQCDSEVGEIIVVGSGIIGSGGGGSGSPRLGGLDNEGNCGACNATAEISQDGILVTGKKGGRRRGIGSWLQSCWAKLPADTKGGLILDGIGTIASFGGPFGGAVAYGAAAAGSTTALGAILLNGVTSDGTGQGIALSGAAFTIGSSIGSTYFVPTDLTGVAKTAAKGLPILGIFVAGGITAVDAYNAALANGCFADG